MKTVPGQDRQLPQQVPSRRTSVAFSMRRWTQALGCVAVAMLAGGAWGGGEVAGQGATNVVPTNRVAAPAGATAPTGVAAQPNAAVQPPAVGRPVSPVQVAPQADPGPLGFAPQNGIPGTAMGTPGGPTGGGVTGGYGLTTYGTRPLPVSPFDNGAGGATAFGGGQFGQPGSGTASAQAQYGAPGQFAGANPFQRGYAGSMLQNPGASAAPVQPLTQNKPFSDYRTPAAVSPYMNLFRVNTLAGLGSAGNYFNLVRPQLEQQQTNQALQQQLRNVQTQQRVQQGNINNLYRQATGLQNSISRPTPGGVRASGGFGAPTGRVLPSVPSGYQNQGNYYPGLQR